MARGVKALAPSLRQCDLWTDAPGQRWEDFTHATDELVTVLEGDMEFEGQVHHPQPGEEMLILAGAVHSARYIGGTTARWLYGYRVAAEICVRLYPYHLFTRLSFQRCTTGQLGYVDIGVATVVLSSQFHQEVVALDKRPCAKLDRIDHRTGVGTPHFIQFCGRQLRVGRIGQEKDHVGGQT